MLRFPQAKAPELNQIIEIAPGVQWLRLPLPYRLDHVNIYLIDSGDGWTILDTGIGTEQCQAVWEALLDGPLRGQRLSSMLVTHCHPDHVGLAGWLDQRLGIPLTMPRPEYLFSLALQYAPGDLGRDSYVSFYQRHGLHPDVTQAVLSRGHQYLSYTSGVPPTYQRIKHGDTVGGRARPFRVMTAGGHSLEQAMLHSPDERLFFAADQVIAKISPNVSVYAMEPTLDALGIYLRSLENLRQTVSDEVLVLPGHGLPFYGLHHRVGELQEHHRQRCDMIAEACRAKPLSVADLVPVVFDRPLDEHQTGFAFGEVLAHVNYMLGHERLWLETTQEIDRYRTR